MRTSDVPLNTINEFKAKGYHIEAYVVVSNYYVSMAGCLFRTEMEIFGNGYGRSVPVDSHDEAYKNIPSTMQKLIDSGKLENLTVMARNGEIIGEFKNGDNVVDIYQNQRNLLSREEYTQINNNLDQVLKMMHERNAKHAEIQNVVKLQKDVQAFFSTQEATKKFEVSEDEEQFDFSL